MKGDKSKIGGDVVCRVHSLVFLHKICTRIIACQQSINHDIISYIMRTYELMLVVNPSFPHDDEKKSKELVDKLLADQDVSDLKVEVWGKKQLAYEIKKQTEAVYLLATFQSAHADSQKLEQKIKLQSDVIRYLLTLKEV